MLQKKKKERKKEKRKKKHLFHINMFFTLCHYYKCLSDTQEFEEEKVVFNLEETTVKSTTLHKQIQEL